MHWFMMALIYSIPVLGVYVLLHAPEIAALLILICVGYAVFLHFKEVVLKDPSWSKLTANKSSRTSHGERKRSRKSRRNRSRSRLSTETALSRADGVHSPPRHFPAEWN